MIILEWIIGAVLLILAIFAWPIYRPVQVGRDFIKHWKAHSKNINHLNQHIGCTGNKDPLYEQWKASIAREMVQDEAKRSGAV